MTRSQHTGHLLINMYVLQEERRIVYIGRIPNDMTKQMMRRQFEHFGDIEEVSVHFREHG